MQVSGATDWVQNARAVVGRHMAQRASQANHPAKTSDFPKLVPAASGLRGMEQTQSLENIQGKGKIINTYA